jgi:cation diffusion facilitator family transporter
VQKISTTSWQHSHTFGQDKKRKGEARTMIVIAITATMMVIEIATGVIFGSIALLADGLHMASHAAALTINVFAYIYARRQAHNHTFSFGTGKVNALGGFTGAVLLAIFALIMVWESIDRILNPVEIAFNQAILVAVIGLIVNGLSVFILGEQREQSHAHDHDKHQHHHDHNLRAAYLHVLADALTSVLAIVALLAGKFIGLNWMDPLMGIIGAILVARWSLGLIRSTSAILLDKQGPESLQNQIKHILEENPDTKITDLHLWSIGPNIYSLVISILAKSPRNPQEYKEQLPVDSGFAHIIIEVNPAESLEDMHP